jgi:murein DD-endopeptidase MepM/ murein hydrolase activator NlpD
MKKRSLLVVSPQGKPIRALPVNFITITLLVLFIVGGFAAYFIPSQRFRLKSAELRQKESLKAQNEMLRQRVGSAQQTLTTLKEQIGKLDEKKELVSSLTGKGENGTEPKRSWLPPRRGSADYADMKPADLFQVASRQERVLDAISATDHPFDSLPLCKPVAGTSLIAQRFGRTQDPFTSSQKFHYGVDLAAAAGTPVIATAAGVVTTCDYSTFWGKRVVIAHSRGLSTIYAHLGTVKVSAGKRVKRGDVIGAIGFSGLATGPHVHYEIWRAGVAVDPEGYFFPSSTATAMNRQ